MEVEHGASVENCEESADVGAHPDREGGGGGGVEGADDVVAEV